MNTRSNDDPPELNYCSPAAQRVYDMLPSADGALSRQVLVNRTRHGKSTVRQAFGYLREYSIVEYHSSWPVPKYKTRRV